MGFLFIGVGGASNSHPFSHPDGRPKTVHTYGQKVGMSFQAMSWAVTQKCANAGQKLVLLMLANYCNSHTGQCNPSHKRLADECSMGVSTLKNHLMALAEIGLLEVVPRYLDGVQLPNQYMLKLGGGGQILTDPQPESDRPPSQNLATNQEFKPRSEPYIAKTGQADLSPSSKQESLKDECPHQAVIAVFHETLPSARRVRDWTTARAQLLRSRWREDPRRQNMDWWRKFFTYVGESDFLMGRTSSERRKPFELGLEWLLKAENFAKVREGAYHEQDGDGK